jgi:hypothetical protein
MVCATMFDERPREQWMAALDVLLVAVAIAAMAFAYTWGLELRRTIWKESAGIRFYGDIENARNQSRNVLLLAAKRSHVDRDKLGQMSFAQVFDGYRATYDAQWDTAELRLQRRIARGRASPDAAPRPELDYPPLRLGVMTLWNWNNARGDRPIDVDYADEPVEPLLDFNAAMTLLACGAAFLLAYDVRRAAGSRAGTSAVLAAIVAGAIWLSPAVLLNAHAWPQWDVWVLPGLLWSAYFARTDRWALAGATLAFFAMFKGQVLLAAMPIATWSVLAGALPRPGWMRFATGALALVAIPLWLAFGTTSANVTYAIVAALTLLALWGMRSAPLLRFACGLLAGAASVLWIWLVIEPAGWTWVIAATVLAGAMMAWPRAPRVGDLGRARLLPSLGRRTALVAGRVSSDRHDIVSAEARREPCPPVAVNAPPLWCCLAAVTLLTLVLPVLHAGWLPVLITVVWGGFVLPLTSRWLIRGRSGVVFGTAGLVVILLGLAYGGSWAFVDVGFPTSRYVAMAMGPNYNLPVLMQSLWGWNVDDAVLTGWTYREASKAVTMAILVAAGVALAVHSKRDDPRLLAAIALPMLVVYALMPQMHERYLLYPACMAALLLAMNAGGWLIWPALTLLSCCTMLTSMISVGRSPGEWGAWLPTIAPLQPGASFTVLTILGVVMALAFTPTWRLKWEPPHRLTPRETKRPRRQATLLQVLRARRPVPSPGAPLEVAT